MHARNRDQPEQAMVGPSAQSVCRREGQRRRQQRVDLCIAAQVACRSGGKVAHARASFVVMCGDARGFDTRLLSAHSHPMIPDTADLDRFDAIVLGSGITGLVATSILFQQGAQNVLVIDEYAQERRKSCRLQNWRLYIRRWKLQHPR